MAFETRVWVSLTLTIVHLSWLGALIALVAAVVAHQLRRARAQSRYFIHVAGLAAIALAATGLFIHAWKVADEIDARRAFAVAQSGSDDVFARGQRASARGANETDENSELNDARDSARLATAQSDSTDRTSARSDRRSASRGATDAGGLSGAGNARRPEANGRLADRRGRSSMERTQYDETQSTNAFAAVWRRLDIERHSPYIAGLYLLGATFMLVRLAGGLVRAHRLCRVARVVVESHVLAVVARQSRAIGVRLVPAVAWCEQVVAPVVLGVVRPMILLPASLATGFDPLQFEALIAHELSHVRRYDLWVNLLQRFAEVVFFFHPGVWYLSRRASAERELACDDAVLAAGWSPLTYAQALVAMAERCHDRVLARGDAAGLAALSPLSAAGSCPTQFKRRVLRLLGDEPAPSMSLGRSGALAVMMLVLSAFVAPLAVVSLESRPNVRPEIERPSAGQNPSVDEKSSAGEKPSADEKRSDAELPSADERPSEAELPTAEARAAETRRSSATEPSTSTAAQTAEWPQFGGGPSRNAVAPDAGVPIAFDLAKGTGILWKAPLGTESFGSPVVAGGKVLIGTNNGGARVARHPKETDLACLLCFDEPTGRFLWQYSSEKLPSGRVHDWPQIGLCSTPCVVGDRVYFMSNRCEVVCIDLNGFHDGENDGAFKEEPSTSKDEADVVWRCDLFDSLGVRPQNQAASSATVVDGLVLLNTSNGVAEDHRKVPAPNAPSFVAVDCESGRVVWSDASPGGNILPTCPSSSPAVARIGGVWQAIFAGGDGWLYAFDLDAMRLGETKLLWKFDVNPKMSRYQFLGKSDRNSLVASPVVAGDRVYIAVGRSPEESEGVGRLWCIDATRRGDISPEFVFNKADPDLPIAHKRFQACDEAAGDFVRPNPNSGAVWEYVGRKGDGGNKGEAKGKVEFTDVMHRTIAGVTVADDLVLVADFPGVLHCIDAKTGEACWTTDLAANVWVMPTVVGKQVFVGTEEGEVVVVELSRQFKRLVQSALDANIVAAPAVAGGRMFWASKRHLFSIGHRREGERGVEQGDGQDAKQSRAAPSGGAKGADEKSTGSQATDAKATDAKSTNSKATTGRLTGQVVDGNSAEPLRGVSVQLRGLVGDGPELGAPNTTTVDDGTFKFDELKPGTYAVSIGAAPKNPRLAADLIAPLSIVAGETKTLEKLSMREGREVRVRVTDEKSGAASPGVRVTAKSRMHASELHVSAFRSAVTDQEGLVTFYLPSSICELQVDEPTRAAALDSRRTLDLSEQPPEQSRRVELKSRVAPAKSPGGAFGAAGGSASKAGVLTVQLKLPLPTRGGGAGETGGGAVDGAGAGDGAGPGAGKGDLPPIAEHIVRQIFTGATGRNFVSMTSLRAGARFEMQYSPDAYGRTAALLIDVPGYEPVRSSEFQIAATMPVLEVELKHATFVTIQGRVVDDDDRPIGDARVRVRRIFHGLTSEFPWGPETATDAEGRFTLRRTRAGEQLVVVADRAGVGQVESAAFLVARPLAAAAPALLVMKLAKAEHDITGVVVDQDGIGVQGATVTHDGEPRSTTQTDSQGNFRLERLPPGKRPLLVVAPTGDRHRHFVNAGQRDARLFVSIASLFNRPEHRLELTARATEGRLPEKLKYFVLDLTEKRWTRSAEIKTDGQVGIDLHTEMRLHGDHEFAVVARGEQFISAAPQKLVTRPQLTPVTLTLRPARDVTLRGRVIDRGKPVAGASVGLSLELADGINDEPWRFLGLTTKIPTTADDGTFEIPKLPAGARVAVYVNDATGAGVWSSRVTLPDAAEFTLPDLTLARGTRQLRGRVVARPSSSTQASSASTPIAGARVMLFDLARRRATSDTTGAFEFRGAPDGDLLLVVEALGFRDESRVVKSSDIEKGELRFELTPDPNQFVPTAREDE